MPRHDPGLKVFIASRDASCGDCGAQLGPKAWISLQQGGGALCLACGDLDHLVFLASGDAALSRRARTSSALSAVVLKWSTARKRYERQGILVEPAALEKAEADCLSDADARARRRDRDSERRAELDDRFVTRFAACVRTMFPRAPTGREHEIASHACLKYSGRVGRTAGAKDLEADAIRLAVQAHVRHRESGYDELLAKGLDRHEARSIVRPDVDRILLEWSEA